MTIMKTAMGGAALAATLLASASPAEARDRYGYRHHDNTGAAVVAGIAGLAIGAAIASSNSGGYYNGGYYDRGYYPQRYYYNSYPSYPIVYYPSYYTYNDGGWYNGYRYDNGYFYDRRGYRSYDRDSWYRHYGRDRDGDGYRGYRHHR